MVIKAASLLAAALALAASGCMTVPRSEVDPALCPVNVFGRQSMRCVMREGQRMIDERQRAAKAKARQDEERYAQEREAKRKALADWIAAHPEEWKRQMRLHEQSMQLNAYGCPGNMLPMGPPMFGCGYPVW